MTTHRAEHLPPGVTDTSVAPEGEPIPPTPAPLTTLPVGHLACWVCGIAVEAHPEDDAEIVNSTHVEGGIGMPPHPRTGEPRYALTVQMLRCQECTATVETARDLLAAHPALGDRLGPDGALHRLTLALVALRAIGQQEQSPPTAATVRLMIRELTIPGGTVLWRARYAPALTRGAKASDCNSTPFGHLSHEHRSVVRAAYTRVLALRAARNSPPHQLIPPATPDDGRHHRIDGGCLMCGVAAVEMPAEQVVARGGPDAARQDIWHPLRTHPRAVGGTGSALPLAGHVCPPCRDALRYVGSTGITACERAMNRYLRDVGREEEAQVIREDETTGLSAWGALVHRQRAQGRAEARPNAEPWQHIAVRR